MPQLYLGRRLYQHGVSSYSNDSLNNGLKGGVGKRACFVCDVVIDQVSGWIGEVIDVAEASVGF